MSDRDDLGRLGERLAAGHLRRLGYEVIATNVRLAPWGEIDIVARSEETLALVEVRTRRGDAFGGAIESLSPTKRRRMLRAAQAYLSSLGDDPPPARIDVIVVRFDRAGKLLGVDHIENAVQAD